jgi:flagellar biosynthesis/type III secretory pathway protein FliH
VCDCVWGELRVSVPHAALAALADHDADREQEIESAYRRGRTDGEQAAHARARKEVEAALGAARAVVREVRDAHAGWNRVLEENIAALATAVATRLVQRELSADAGLQHELVRQALAAFPPHQEIRIHVHPSDLAVLTKPEGDSSDLPARDLRWVADEGIVRGGCLVEGPERIVDGRLDEGLKRIYRALVHD